MRDKKPTQEVDDGSGSCEHPSNDGILERSGSRTEDIRTYYMYHGSIKHILISDEERRDLEAHDHIEAEAVHPGPHRSRERENEIRRR